MKCLLVADLHYALPQFDWLLLQAPQYELIILAGDFIDATAHVDMRVQTVVVEKYLRRLSALTTLLVASGNHDVIDRNLHDEPAATWLHDLKDDSLLVDGDSWQQQSLLVSVCPWWEGEQTRAEVATFLEKESKKTKDHWIWIHHGPPDQSSVSWTGKKFGGDPSLNTWIERYNPDLVLSGHIHQAPFQTKGSWMDRVGKTNVFNPGRQIGPIPTFISLDLDSKEVVWKSLEGIEERSLTPA